MARFYVEGLMSFVHRIWYYDVEADTPEQAVEFCKSGQADYDDHEQVDSTLPEHQKWLVTLECEREDSESEKDEGDGSPNLPSAPPPSSTHPGELKWSWEGYTVTKKEDEDGSDSYVLTGPDGPLGTFKDLWDAKAKAGGKSGDWVPTIVEVEIFNCLDCGAEGEVLVENHEETRYICDECWKRRMTAWEARKAENHG